MTKSSFFSESHLALQKRYRGEKVAERLLEHRVSTKLSDTDRVLVEESRFFFIASGSDSFIDCSIKAGDPGFVRVISPTEIQWPNYDGNRMYRTLGNIKANSFVSILFVDFESPATKSGPSKTSKLRLTGRAAIDDSEEALTLFHGAKQLVNLQIEFVFPNCPRYLPSLMFDQGSPFTPRPSYKPPVPEWKTRDYIAEVLNDEN